MDSPQSSASPTNRLTDEEYYSLEDEPIHEYNDADYYNYYIRHAINFETLHEAYYKEDEIGETFEMENAQLEELGQQIREIQDQKAYEIHTDFMHDYWRHSIPLTNYFVCRNKAFLKMCEILYYYVQDRIPWSNLKSFHMCEGPGYFIDATYYIWRIFTRGQKGREWDWAANTLNPYFENRSCFEKLIDDSHIRGHEQQWYFGPSNDGDIFKFDEEYVTRMELKGQFDLVTADGSINTQGQEGHIEELVAPLILAEVKAALLLLKPGGCLILKTYRFSVEPMREIMMLLANNFSSMGSFKPNASRPGSAERYVICFEYGGQTHLPLALLKVCDGHYTRHQIRRIRKHLKTFETQEMSYTAEDKKRYIEERRERFFTKELHQHVRALQQEFPFVRNPSPWRRMYGHDLIRRNTLENRALAVERLLNTTSPLEPNIDYLIPGLVLDDILSREVIWDISDIPLEVKDSLFMEPLALQAIHEAEPRVYFDIFENLSTSIVSEEMSRRRFLGEHIEDEKSLGYLLNVEEGFTMDHLLAALQDGIDANMTTFTLRFPKDRICNLLWLSRLSASIYILMWIIFEDIEFGQTWICWEKKRPETVSNIRVLLHRLRQEINYHPSGCSLRSFVAPEIFHEFHAMLCWRNAMALWSNN